MKEESNNIKLNEINELKNQIEATKQEIIFLEQCLDDPSDFLKFSSAKIDLAVSTLNESFLSEIKEVEEQISDLRKEHKEKLAKFDKDILEEKEKVRNMLLKLDEEIKTRETKPEKAKEQLPNQGYRYYSNVPALAEEEKKIDTNSSSKVREEKNDGQRLYDSSSSVAKPSTYSIDRATDEEIETLVRELKARKNSRKEIDLPDEPEEPKSYEPEAKVLEGFWEDDLSEETEKPVEEEVEISIEDSSKHAFIIGKFAGDNLLDESGKLIIAKDEIITEEVIAKAEAEGKLVNLIIDMKF